MEDRIAGALALSALADAVGFAHEPRGLAGEIGDQEAEWLPRVQPYRESKANPWNLWATRRQTRGRRGVVTDDTAFRIAIFEPWLDQATVVSEAAFRDWLRRTSLPHPVAGRLARILEKTWRAAERGRAYGFHEPGRLTNWGPFLYGTLMFRVPYDQLVGFSVLDPTHALARFACGPSLGVEPTDALEFLGGVRERTREWAWPFHPDRHWLEVQAVLSFAGGDPARLLSVVRAFPGDADTIGAHAGLHLGFELGFERVFRAVGPHWRVVEETTRAFFGVTLEDRVRVYTK